MKDKKFFLIMLFILSVFFTSELSFAESRELTIVFSGDMRGELENCHCPKEDFGGLPRRSKYISGVRKEADDILVIDVGDVLPLFTPDLDEAKIAYNAAISFKAMEMMGYSVMNVGESDLILGEAFLEEKASSLPFSFISANIIDKDTGQPFFAPYVIKTMEGGLKVGILGLVNERYIINSERLDIVPNKEAALRYLPELRSKSDIIIVLGHLGLPYSMELANNVEGIDVILSGHWDTESQEPVKIVNTLVMPTTYHSRKIGRLDLKIKNGGISSYRWESTPLDEGYDGDRLMEKLVSKVDDIGNVKKAEEPYVTKMAAERPLRIFAFYSPGCRACMEVEKDFLPEIREKYGDNIVIEELDVSALKNYEQMARLEKLYGVKEGDGGYVPEVIVSKYVLMGKEQIVSRLESVIESALSEEPDISKKNEAGAAEYQIPEGHLVLSRFQSFSLLAVTTAGALDGINPCAFTTIVFFISFLAFVGYKRKEMFFAGTSFTIAVFITYLLIGLGIFRFLRSLSGFGYAANFINITIGGLAFLLGVISIVDYFKFKKTRDTKSIILKLPQFIKNRIHSVIGSEFRADSKQPKRNFLKIIWVALTSGFLVSVLESFCTGQVYLPTIAFVLKMPDRKLSALSYLLAYNLAFIMPLILVFLLGLLGATSKTFSGFMEKRLGAVKLSTAVLFFTLSAVLLILK